MSVNAALDAAVNTLAQGQGLAAVDLSNTLAQGLAGQGLTGAGNAVSSVADANTNFNAAIEQMMQQCSKLASNIPGGVCKGCDGGEFRVDCDKTIGPAAAEFSLVVDPCQNNIQVTAEATVIGNQLPPIKYIWERESPLEKTLQESFSLKGFELTGTLDMAVSNPAKNVLNVRATADACISVKADTLLGNQKANVEKACQFVGLASTLSGRRRDFASSLGNIFDKVTDKVTDVGTGLIEKGKESIGNAGELLGNAGELLGQATGALSKVCTLLLESENNPQCGPAISDLFTDAIPEFVKDLAESKLGIKDLELPLKLVNEDINYLCVDENGEEIEVNLKTGNSRIGNPNTKALKALADSTDDAYSFGASLAVAGSGLVAVFSL